jgi:hypothetical protein
VAAARPVFQRAVLCLLLAAVVLAQALGLMHRVVHLPNAPAQLDQRSGHGHGHAHAHEAGWVASLFAGHADDSSCRLFDPLNHEAAPSVPVVALPAVAALFFLDAFQGDFVARWAALFDARGPPLPH